MYPDWPLSTADLVPLPRCDGPKLKAFDFGGAQKIEFLDYVGEGLHAHVFKVQIHGQIYALKLFRFVYDEDWVGPAEDEDANDRELMSAFYDYSEPFSCECRAFGRLQEAGHEELAIACFGYVLLDDDHESALRRRFPKLHFNGNIECAGYEDLRSRFLGRNGRPPPIRGIVKEFRNPGEEEDELNPATARKMLDDVRRLQQLGILRIDVAARQLLGGQISDFSTAITVPHFLTTPELNPALTPQMRNAMELDTFRLSKDDYLSFDDMVYDWNLTHAEEKGGRITTSAYPGCHGSPLLQSPGLRNKAAQKRVFTYVNPTKYNWKWKSNGINKCRRKLRARPPIWTYNCGDDDELAWTLVRSQPGGYRLQWEYRDGLIFPRV